jgi:hypothetical protein
LGELTPIPWARSGQTGFSGRTHYRKQDVIATATTTSAQTKTSASPTRTMAGGRTRAEGCCALLGLRNAMALTTTYTRATKTRSNPYRLPINKLEHVVIAGVE